MRVNERCERTSDRRCEWPSTLRVDFIVILPTVHLGGNMRKGEDEGKEMKKREMWRKR